MATEPRHEYHELRKASRVFRDGFLRRTETAAQLLADVLGGRAFRLLDVGSADGMMLEHLRDRFPQAEILGLEASPELVEVARRRGVDVRQGNARALDLPDESFDAVTVFSTLKHISGVEAALAEFHRVLVPGGYLIVSDPTPMGLRLGRLRGHFDPRYLPNVWSLAATRRHLEMAGFQFVRGLRYMPVPVTFPGSRALERGMRSVGLSRMFMQQATLVRKP